MGDKPRPPSCRNLENFSNHYPPDTYKEEAQQILYPAYS
jgi:hypothetical protein